MIAAVPTLEEIENDPAVTAGLSAEVLGVLLARCAAELSRYAAIQGALTAALTISQSTPDRKSSHAPAADRTLNADEIARELGQTRRWVFRNAKALPFVRRISRKALAGSEAGLRRWRDARRA